MAPAECSSWELRLRQPPDLGEGVVIVAPGGRIHRQQGAIFSVYIFTFIALGHWSHWAGLLNYISSLCSDR
jgi:hypothetical protein